MKSREELTEQAIKTAKKLNTNELTILINELVIQLANKRIIL